MVRKKIGKKAAAEPQVVLKKVKLKKASPKLKHQRGLTNAEWRELMKTNKPPQSWYDEDHTGLY